MKDIKEVEAQLSLVIREWMHKQASNPHTVYYMFYCPSTAMSDSGLSIRQTPPPNNTHGMELVSAKPLDGFKTDTDNFRFFFAILKTLPVLDN